MRLVFMGSPDFAVVHLRELVRSGHEIVSVVTTSDKPQGRGRVLRPSPVKDAALALGIPVLQPESLKSTEFITQLKKLNAELFIVVAFRILPPEVFNLPAMGTINVHASLLPKYRGAAPINRAIMNGESETGVTIIRIDERVDTGQMLAVRKVAIDPDMDAGTLHDTLALTGAALLVDTLKNINIIQPLKQNNALATKAPKIKKETCHLNFNRSAFELYNQIRGLSPSPGAFCFHENKMLKIFHSQLIEDGSNNNRPGQVVQTDKDSFDIACASGILRILEVQIQGKRRMSVKEFFNGYKISCGDLLQ